MFTRPRANTFQLVHSLSLALVLSCSLACAQSSTKPSTDTDQPRVTKKESARLEAVKDKLWDRLSRDPAVLGVGIGQSKADPKSPSILVYVNNTASDEELKKKIPFEVDGIPTRVIRADQFKAYGSEHSEQHK